LGKEIDIDTRSKGILYITYVLSGKNFASFSATRTFGQIFWDALQWNWDSRVGFNQFNKGRAPRQLEDGRTVFDDSNQCTWTSKNQSNEL